MFANASGYLWTAAYINEIGDLVADILSDITSKQRLKLFIKIFIVKLMIVALEKQLTFY